MNANKTASTVNTLLYLCSRKDINVKHLELHKLLYLSCGYYYAEHNEWLIGSGFDAYPYGPVNKAIYHAYKDTHKNINYYLNPSDEFQCGEEQFIINNVLKKYGKYKDLRLAQVTQGKDTPWFETVQNKGFYKNIDKVLIKKYFKKIIDI